MADRVDAVMNPMQSPRRDPPRHPTLVDTHPSELRRSDDAMLSFRNSRHLHIDRGAFLSHTESYAPRYRGSPP